MKKSVLRKFYLQKRKELSLTEIEQLTHAIAGQFFKLDFSDVKYLHLFYPIPEKLEFNALILAEWIRKNHPEINLVLSKSNLETHTLSHFIWDANTTLSINNWGITEPEDGITVRPNSLDMIMVPLLAFDLQGNRVGYGKGFYDRFLAACKPSAKKVGLSYFEPIPIIEDLDQFDIKLDACISPGQIWTF